MRISDEDFLRCSEDSTHPILVVEESGRRFIIRNPERTFIKKIQVDHCLIENRECCDFVFELGDICYCSIYVELKGSDIDKAYNQLVATLGYLSDRHRQIKKICHIVASRVPKAGPKTQNLRAEMARKHKILLFIGTNEISINTQHKPYIPE